MGCLNSQSTIKTKKEHDSPKEKDRNSTILNEGSFEHVAVDITLSPNKFDLTYHKPPLLEIEENSIHDELFKDLDVRTIQDDIQLYFDIQEDIGQGHFGIVRKAYKINGDHSKSYAIKTIPKDKINTSNLQYLYTEIDILGKADHPNIVKFFWTYQDAQYFHIVMQNCLGGDLFDRILSAHKFTQQRAAFLTKSIVSAVNYLHSNNICHRDIKPENFLFASLEKEAEIKMIDFGLSKKFAQEEVKEVEKIVGTVYYMAPEVLIGKYDLSCDMWSLGVLVSVMLTGIPPFLGRNRDEIFRNIMFQKVNFQNAIWEQISPAAMDFVSKLLIFEPDKRMTAQEALSHEWISGVTKMGKKVKLDPAILARLQKYRAPDRFIREALGVMAKFLTDKEIRNLIEQFRILDNNHTGFISFKNLQDVLKNYYKESVPEEVHAILKEFNPEENEEQNVIKYSDFLIATMDRKLYNNKKLLWRVFKFFDIDNTCFITKENIVDAFRMYDKTITEEEAAQMIFQANPKSKDRIDFDEFFNMIIKEEKGGITKNSLVPDIENSKKASQNRELSAKNLHEFRRISLAGGMTENDIDRMVTEKSFNLNKSQLSGVSLISPPLSVKQETVNY